MVKNVLLVGGASSFVIVLAKKLRAVGAKVYILDENQADLDDVEFIYGKSCNTDLVKRIIEDYKITRLFLLPRQSHAQNAETLGREILLGTAALIDQIRRISSDLPQILHIGHFDEDSDDFANYKAAVLSTEAFLHSYAVSYRMDVRLLRIPAFAALSNYDRLAKEVLEIGSEVSKEPAKIYNLTAEVEETPSVSSSSTQNVRILVYGAKGWIGQQFVDTLKAHGNTYFIGQTRPGQTKDEEVRKEIAAIAPSHIVSLIGRTHGPGCGNIDYLEGGPDKLKENVRDNLYGPWFLANLCEQFGIHFTYLGTGCLFPYLKGGDYKKESDLPYFKGNNYSVVKGFTDRLIPVFKNSLNARIRLPFNHEKSPRNLLNKLTNFNKILDVKNSLTYLPDLLPIFLNLIIKRQTGTVNLVSPGVITFSDMADIYSQESGEKLVFEKVSLEDDPSGTASRAHCKLDTSLLQKLAPNVLNIEAAVRQASRQLAQ